MNILKIYFNDTLFIYYIKPFLLIGLSNVVNYPVTVIDETGTAVTISKEPQRLISTAPSNTEILFALGLGEKVVGITNYCNFPEESKNIEKLERSLL